MAQQAARIIETSEFRVQHACGCRITYRTANYPTGSILPSEHKPCPYCARPEPTPPGPGSRPKESAAARNDRMLHASFLKNTRVQVLPYGSYAMRSDSTPLNVWYFVTAGSCACAWAQNNDSPCSHMMRARFEDEFRADTEPIAA